jgi:hypothetical protein
MLVANVVPGPSLLVILSAAEESLAQGKLCVAIPGMALGRNVHRNGENYQRLALLS